MCGFKIDIVQKNNARLISYKRTTPDHIVQENNARSYRTREQCQIILYKGFNVGRNGKRNEAVQCVCEVKWSPNVTQWEDEYPNMLRFLDYLYAYHTQTIMGTASFLYLQSIHKVLTLIFVLLYRDSCYHCTIWSRLSTSVWYNLLWVQLSLLDAHWPLLSFTYTSIYDEKYINCTIRTLRP